MVAVKEHVDYGDVETDDYLETYKSSFSFTTWIEVTKYGIPINFTELAFYHYSSLEFIENNSVP